MWDNRMSTWRMEKKEEAERQAAKFKAKEEKEKRENEERAKRGLGPKVLTPQEKKEAALWWEADRAYDMLVSKLPSKYYVHSVICSYRHIQKSFISRNHEDFKQELYNWLEDLNEDSMELDDAQIVLVYG
jgi:hypothetical protein